MAYNGSIELISGLKPKNNGDFPLVNAQDVQVDDDGTRLPVMLAKITEVQGVDVLPASPDPKVLYLIRAEGGRT